MRRITRTCSNLMLAACTALSALLTAVAPVAAMDRALVIGVNEYSRLPSGSNLAGCVNDAERMAAALRRYHFQVSLLTDGQATRQGILSALDEMKGAIGGTDRVVFYFAGHGTLASHSEAVLLPSDAEDNSETHDIRTHELYDAMRAMPAASKTVILDSCFSGGMMRSIRRHAKLLSRFYFRSRLRRSLDREGKRWLLTSTNHQDSNHEVAPAGGICYYTACMGNEVSNEKDIEGNRDGLFTYYLTQRLRGQGDLWQDISSAVNRHVSDDSEDLQHPRLSPAYLNKRCFEGKRGSDDPKPCPHDLADLYSTSNPDQRIVDLSTAPTVSPVTVKQDVGFHVTIGRGGYLVLLGRDPNDEIYVMYPPNGGADAAKVSVGEMNLGHFMPDTAGTDRVKAFLFSVREGADRLLCTMSSAGPGRSGKRSTVMHALQLRRWQPLAGGSGADFYTSELINEIVPQSEAK